MANSAQEKAYNLKDAYVAGLIEGEAAGSAPVMPEQGMGEVAGVMLNLDKGTKTEVNDGLPNQFVRSGGETFVRDENAIMGGRMSRKAQEGILMPIRGPFGNPYPYGTQKVSPLNMNEIHGANHMLHNLKHELRRQ